MEKNPEKIEREELSREIISEWREKEEVPEITYEKEDLSSPDFSHSKERKEDLQEKEEKKKDTVKREVKELLAVAEVKGLDYSIKEARKKNDPFLLDVYHDVLAKGSSYKDFLKK